MKNRNNSNIDIIKIIGILFIIAHHFVYDAISLNIIDSSNYFYNFLYLGGKFGTALFVIISGYFISKKEFEFKRILKLIIRVEIYSYLLFFIFAFVFKYKIDFTNTMKSLLPVITNRYWFATSYVILYFLSPYINVVIDKINKTMYIKLLILLTILLIFFPILNFNYIFNNTSCLIYYYLIGAYINKYEFKIFSKNYLHLITSILLYLLIFISSIVILKLSSAHHFLIGREYYFTRLNSILVVGSSVLCFIYFINSKIKYRRIFGFLSASTFGIYLLHDNYLIKNYIFPEVFKYIQMSNYKYVYSILFILIVFVICAVIDYFVSLFINWLFKHFSRRKKSLENVQNV
ncbi:MAG: acyltransferase family protein [Bacilli bacterium]|nr:acyltransferase family protein [Bacilli bacterium]